MNAEKNEKKVIPKSIIYLLTISRITSFIFLLALLLLLARMVTGSLPFF